MQNLVYLVSKHFLIHDHTFNLKLQKFLLVKIKYSVKIWNSSKYLAMDYTKKINDSLFEIDEKRKQQLMLELGRRIKIARDEARMSQLKVGVALGVSDKTISGYESGRIAPPIDKLLQLADLFKKPITYFLGSDSKDYKVASRLRAVEVALRDIRKQLQEIKLISQTVDLDN